MEIDAKELFRLSRANRYETDRHGNENRLRFWLALDKWSRDEAALLFMDMDPDSIRKTALGEWDYFESFSGVLHICYDYDREGFPVPVAAGRDGENLYVAPGTAHMLATLQSMFNDSQRLLSRYVEATPVEWVRLAHEKNINIPWLDWAERRDLIEVWPDAQKETATSANDAYISGQPASVDGSEAPSFSPSGMAVNSQAYRNLHRAIADFPARYPDHKARAPKLDEDVRPWLKSCGYAKNDREAHIWGVILADHFGF